MTRNELANLNIDTEEMDKSLGILKTGIVDAAKLYASEKMKGEADIAALRARIRQENGEKPVESPVDYVKTVIKSLPLAADSINMDVQYFSNDTNNEGGKTVSMQISSYVAQQTSFLGASASKQASAAAGEQSSRQFKKHQVIGTLVISAACTHKNATVLAPFVLNVDKAIKVWNCLFTEDEHKINPGNQKSMEKALTEPETNDSPKFSVISGTTYGSSFVGMVHILKTTETKVTHDLSSLAATLQAQMDAGSWFESASGGFGVNASIGKEVKNLLSTQNISSHVTMICMGVIPSMVANDVKMGVDRFAQFDPKSSMEAIATIQNSTIGEQGSLADSAEAARTGGKMIAMKGGEIKAALGALAEIDDGANKVLDINSMMAALDDYLKKAADGTSGVPINYYLKDITKSMLAEMWVAKYYPKKYMAIQNDDTEVPQQNGGNTGA